MENGGVYTTVINSRQHKIGQIVDYSTLLPSSVFVLQKHEVLQIVSQTMGHALMNLVNTTLFQK